MNEPEIVKVQTNHHGDEAVLIYAKGRKRAVHQREPVLSKAMGKRGARYFLAVWLADEHRWVLDKQINTQSW